MVTLFDERLKSQYEASPEELERRERAYDLNMKREIIEGAMESGHDFFLNLSVLLNPPQEIMNKCDDIKSWLEDLEKDVIKDLEELEGRQ